jgi:kumamolisin
MKFNASIEAEKIAGMGKMQLYMPQVESSKPIKVLLPGSERKPFGERIGPYPNDQKMMVSVILKPSSPLPVASSPSAHPVSREDFAARHGADPAAIEKLVDFALQQDLRITEVSLTRRTVRLEGMVADFMKAFDVSLEECAHQGRHYRCRTGGIMIPADLADSILAVLGLDNRPQVRPYCRTPKRNKAIAADAEVTGYTGVQVGQLYDFPLEEFDGSGQTIGILEFGGGFRPQQVSDYFQTIGAKLPLITWVSVDGGQNDPATNPINGPTGPPHPPIENLDTEDGSFFDDLEVCLDIEIAGAVAPGARIVVYFAPLETDEEYVNALTTAIDDNINSPSVISISWGNPEPASTQQYVSAFNQAAIDAAMLGITICVASGDAGSSDSVDDGQSHVDFPASSPNVLACGGTTLHCVGAEITSEIVWNDSSGATGGGFSSLFPLPAYQSAAGIQSPTGGRGVPDVSGNAGAASPYMIGVDGGMGPANGTSAVAPLWSGLVALMNQALGKRLGFFNSSLYSLPARLAGFRDITSGSNGNYSAGPGWDPTTGLGSPSGRGLLAALSNGAMVIVPNVFGEVGKEAEIELNHAGLSAIFSGDLRETSTVFTQRPPAGNVAAKGSVVFVFLIARETD